MEWDGSGLVGCLPIVGLGCIVNLIKLSERDLVSINIHRFKRVTVIVSAR